MRPQHVYRASRYLPRRSENRPEASAMASREDLGRRLTLESFSSREMVSLSRRWSAQNQAASHRPWLEDPACRRVTFAAFTVNSPARVMPQPATVRTSRAQRTRASLSETNARKFRQASLGRRIKTVLATTITSKITAGICGIVAVETDCVGIRQTGTTCPMALQHSDAIQRQPWSSAFPDHRR
jgi:hypothetical protein